MYFWAIPHYGKKMRTTEQTSEMLSDLRKLDILGLLDRQGIAHNRGWGWPCPSCGVEKKDNGCKVYRHDTTKWKCFQCGVGGSAIDVWLLWQNLNPEHLSFNEYKALEDLSGEQTTTIEHKPSPPPDPPLFNTVQIQAYWRQYLLQPRGAVDAWLVNTRKLPSILMKHIGLAPTSLLPKSRMDLRKIAEQLPLAVFALRSTHPERLGEVQNLVVRPIRPMEGVKARGFNKGTGTTRDNGIYPMVYGNPVDAWTARTLVVVEGGPDWLAADALCRYIPGAVAVGAFCVDDLRTVWGHWLKDWPGEHIIIVPHIDPIQWKCGNCRAGWRKLKKFPLLHGGCPTCGHKVEKRRPGIAGMSELLDELGRGTPFSWRQFLELCDISLDLFMSQGATDLNDVTMKCGIPWPTVVDAWKGVMDELQKL